MFPTEIVQCVQIGEAQGLGIDGREVQRRMGIGEVNTKITRVEFVALLKKDERC